MCGFLNKGEYKIRPYDVQNRILLGQISQSAQRKLGEQAGSSDVSSVAPSALDNKDPIPWAPSEANESVTAKKRGLGGTLLGLVFPGYGGISYIKGSTGIFNILPDIFSWLELFSIYLAILYMENWPHKNIAG